MLRSFAQKNMISYLGIGIATSISGLVLNAFWKIVLHLLHSNKNIHILTPLNEV